MFQNIQKRGEYLNACNIWTYLFILLAITLLLFDSAMKRKHTKRLLKDYAQEKRKKKNISSAIATKPETKFSI